MQYFCRKFLCFCAFRKTIQGVRLFMKYILHSFKTILFLLLLMAAIPHAMAQKSGKKPFTVVIDAGHGGVDPGALGKKSQEKNINFNVSNRLGKMINEAYPEVKVIYTRTTDVKIPLARRADIANKENANLFISIHSNASKNRNANGCQTFTLGAGSDAEAKAAAMYENEVILSEDNFEETYQGFDPRSSESYIIFELMRSHDMEMSVKLAEMVQKGMLKTTSLNDRGVSSAGFLVLHRTVMPSILVELGFITNSKDESLIASKEGQEKLAKGIFDGFANYYELYGRSKEAKKSADTPTTAKKESSAKSDRPVFKIQIMASESELKSNDKRFKGLATDYYKENGVYKYTYGESEDYNAILRMKKEIADKFKDAFVIAFLNGEKISTAKAIEIFKKQTKTK
ncbi:MAG: N-acetylmuramoyl-L-alanine amidase [Bacteroidaceae bacterium]|nr:N-acetylmuramoyl-L-alanine amidase [Bacteroidaceae bacterium]